MNLNLVIPGNRIGDAWQYSDGASSIASICIPLPAMT